MRQNKPVSEPMPQKAQAQPSHPSHGNAPVMDRPVKSLSLVEARGLTKHFLPSRLWVLAGAKVTRAVEDVSFTIDQGEVLGLVGESGCGKTTTGRLLLRLIEPTAGQIYFNGKEVTSFNRQELIEYRRQAQIIFQNPFSTLNPRRTIESSLGVGLEVYGLAGSKKEKRERLGDLLKRVGLSPDMLDRYPHQFSGGQRQRLVIARALAVEPKFIVADEPVSALDVSIQAQVLNLIRDLQQSLNLTMLFISHDLRTIYHMSDRIGVMYLGRLVELAPRQRLYQNPLHPYTQALITAAPSLEPGETLDQVIKGEVWDKPPPPQGCVFYHRCPLAVPDCEHIVPELDDKEPGHSVACWRV